MTLRNHQDAVEAAFGERELPEDSPIMTVEGMGEPFDERRCG